MLYVVGDNFQAPSTHALSTRAFLSISCTHAFFLTVHVYNVALLYLLVSKPTLHPACLPMPRRASVEGNGSTKQRWLVRPNILGWATLFIIDLGLCCSITKLGFDGRKAPMTLLLVWIAGLLLVLWCVRLQLKRKVHHSS